MARKATIQLKVHGQVVQTLPLEQADIEAMIAGLPDTRPGATDLWRGGKSIDSLAYAAGDASRRRIPLCDVTPQKLQVALRLPAPMNARASGFRLRRRKLVVRSPAVEPGSDVFVRDSRLSGIRVADGLFDPCDLPALHLEILGKRLVASSSHERPGDLPRVHP